jgi:hypothetical protein
MSLRIHWWLFLPELRNGSNHNGLLILHYLFITRCSPLLATYFTLNFNFFRFYLGRFTEYFLIVGYRRLWNSSVLVAKLVTHFIFYPVLIYYLLLWLTKLKRFCQVSVYYASNQLTLYFVTLHKLSSLEILFLAKY